MSLGALIAPLLSGTIVEHTSFRWAFAATGLLALVAAAAAWLLTGESSAPEGRSLDWLGQITVALSLLALLYGIIQGPSDSWSSAPVVLSFVTAAALLGAFIWAENRSGSPMLRLELFRIPAFAASAAMAIIGMFGFLGGAYDLSIRLGVIQHKSPLETAVPFLVIQGITPFIWPLLVRLLHRVGPGLMLVAGFTALAAAQLWLREVPIHETGLVPLLGPLILNGVGFGLVVAAITAAVNVVPPSLTGMASATTSLVRDLGQTLGPALVGAVALGMATNKLTDSLAGAGLTSAEHGTATAVLDAGGPIALHTAELGPLSAKLAPLTERALADGYNCCTRQTPWCSLATRRCATQWTGPHGRRDPRALSETSMSVTRSHLQNQACLPPGYTALSGELFLCACRDGWQAADVKESERGCPTCGGRARPG
ncbi:MFS transporter [Streptomyces hawaiiensis]|uniref:MFS transporter n=1 Tax=Streptomyces hawaiiensis TaxID=67305 RepID=UPI0024823B18|nr:MFS transporter [Streptomyces hawaiiensis]